MVMPLDEKTNPKYSDDLDIARFNYGMGPLDGRAAGVFSAAGFNMRICLRGDAGWRQAPPCEQERKMMKS